MVEGVKNKALEFTALGVATAVVALAWGETAHALPEGMSWFENPLFDNIPDVSGFPKNELLSLQMLDNKIANLEKEQAPVVELFQELKRLSPFQDPSVVPEIQKLSEVVKYYETALAELKSLRSAVPADVRTLGELQLINSHERRMQEIFNTEKEIRTRISDIRHKDFSLLPADQERIRADYEAARDLLQAARPGSVLVEEGGAWTWKTLSELGIQAKNDLRIDYPLSTARAFYDFQVYLDALNKTTPVIGAPISDPAAQKTITEGWPELTADHKTHDGGPVDFRTMRNADGSYDPVAVAKVLAAADSFDAKYYSVAQGYTEEAFAVYFELTPGYNEKDFEERVVKALMGLGQGVDEEKARMIAEKYIRVIGHATGPHFHMDTPRPLIQAPNKDIVMN